MRVTDKHTFFWNGYLSQWFSCEFKVDGIEYSCTEQYMMHQKALLFKDYDIAKKIIESELPNEQKKLGRQVSNFDLNVWNDNARKIVYKGNHAKFTQNKKLYTKLMQTGNTLLVEASPYDKIWGIGMAEEDTGIDDESNWKGKNWLGEVITKVRDNLILTETIYDHQHNPKFHPLTCGNNSNHALLYGDSHEIDLVLKCPDCDYVQTNIPIGVIEDFKDINIYNDEIEDFNKI